MTPVEICNMALGWIGAKPVPAIIETDPLWAPSVEAELCRDQFVPAVKSALADRAWLFATGFLTLDTPAGSVVPDLPLGWTIESTMNIVTVRAVDDGSGNFNVKFQRVGDLLLTEDTGTTEIIVEATVYSADSSGWDPNFVRCVAALLASDFAVPLTEGTAMQDRMEKKYVRELDKAGRLDSMQASPRRLRVGRSSLKRVR